MTRTTWGRLLLTCLLPAFAACAQAPGTPQTQSPLDAGELSVERVADGFGITEGPLWHEGSLLFVDVTNSRIHRWTPDGGAEIFREPSGRANGLAVTPAGDLIVAQRDRRLSRVTPDGRETVLAEHFRGQRLNSPNDIALGSDGSIYFTDPPFGVDEEQAELDFSGVFRLLDDGTLQLLSDDLGMPNGVVLSPDESRLYVSDSSGGNVRVFEVGEDGGVDEGRLFASLEDPHATGDPDGMTIDGDGNLYVAGPGGVWIFTPDGSLHRRITIPEEHTTNLTWGDADGRTLYVTAVSHVGDEYVGRLYRLRSGTESDHDG